MAIGSSVASIGRPVDRMAEDAAMDRIPRGWHSGTLAWPCEGHAGSSSAVLRDEDPVEDRARVLQGIDGGLVRLRVAEGEPRRCGTAGWECRLGRPWRGNVEMVEVSARGV